MVLRFIYFTLTTSKLWLWSSLTHGLVSPSWCTSFSILHCVFTCCLHKDLQTTLKWSSLPHSPCSFPYTKHWMGGFSVPQYLHSLLCGVPCTYFCMFCQIASKYLTSLILFSMLLCALCASTLCAQLSTCFLVVCSMLFLGLWLLLISHQSHHHHLACLWTAPLIIY